MIRSMTGYGKARGKIGGRDYIAEIRSLNSKQLNLRLQLPARFQEQEIELRSWLGEKIHRGRVDLIITEEGEEGEQLYRINGPVLQAHYREMKKQAEELDVDEKGLLGSLLRIPDVLRYECPEADKTETEALWALLEKAFEAFDRFAAKEGERTQRDLEEQLKGIAAGLDKVEAFEDERREKVRKRLTNRAKELQKDVELDKARFEEELFYYLERMDINEEKTRLRSHIEQFTSVMKEEGSGKKLHFIAQEIGREVNTIGSKADHAAMQHEVVNMKDQLERIKEQLMNLR